MDQKRLELQLAVPGRPVRIDVDPEFDLFRKLDRDETPAALTQALGARNMLVLLPSAAPKALLEAYGDLARSLSESGPDNVEVKLDSQIQHIPSDRSVVLLGWENAFRSQVVSALSQFDVTVKAKEVRIGRKTIPKKDHALVLTARQLENAESSLTWVASGSPEALPGLGRKLPHYHKYSYLGFQGDEPENITKGRWPVFTHDCFFATRGRYGLPDRKRKTKTQEIAGKASPGLFQKSRDGDCPLSIKQRFGRTGLRHKRVG